MACEDHKYECRKVSWCTIVLNFDRNKMYIFRVGLYYFGTGEVGEVKGFNSLFDYSRDNKLKFGILNVKRKSLIKAVEEADVENF